MSAVAAVMVNVPAPGEASNLPPPPRSAPLNLPVVLAVFPRYVVDVVEAPVKDELIVILSVLKCWALTGCSAQKLIKIAVSSCHIGLYGLTCRVRVCMRERNGF